MISTFRKNRPPEASQPETLAFDKHAYPSRVHVFCYNQDEVKEYDLDSPAQLDALTREQGVVWVDVQGLADGRILNKLGEVFSLHPLTMGDIIHIPQRPKSEDYESYIFVVLSQPEIETAPVVLPEQISLVLGKNFVISFQERYGDTFDPIRTRIRKGYGQIRKSGADHLAYAIIDAVVDGFYPVLEKLGEYLDDLEDTLIHRWSRKELANVHLAKRNLLLLRRSIWPLREALNSLLRDDNKLLKKTTRIFMRDCYDHCVQTIDVLENYRDLCAALTDLYLSGVNNRLNEIMKVLTIISTVFIPLSFFAGVYGMNFEYFPELRWHWGYPAFWIGCFFVAGFMLLFFKRLGWLQLGEESNFAE